MQRGCPWQLWRPRRRAPAASGSALSAAARAPARRAIQKFRPAPSFSQVSRGQLTTASPRPVFYPIDTYTLLQFARPSGQPHQPGLPFSVRSSAQLNSAQSRIESDPTCITALQRFRFRLAYAEQPDSAPCTRPTQLRPTFSRPRCLPGATAQPQPQPPHQLQASQPNLQTLSLPKLHSASKQRLPRAGSAPPRLCPARLTRDSTLQPQHRYQRNRAQTDQLPSCHA